MKGDTAGFVVRNHLPGRSPRGVLASVLALLLMSACTGDGGPSGPDPALTAADAEPSQTPSPSSTPEPSATATAEPSPSPSPASARVIVPTKRCPGIGKVPKEGQVTFFENRELRAKSPRGGELECLVRGRNVGGNLLPAVWSPSGDAVLLGDQVLRRDGSLTRPLTPWIRGLEWSPPRGTAVMYESEASKLKRRSSTGKGRALDISFLERHDAVTFHPAGEHLATSGLDSKGEYGLYLATKTGADRQPLTTGEAVRRVTDLRFSGDGRWLYYSARHGPRKWHFHRLEIGGEGRLETLDQSPFRVTYALSPSGFVGWFAEGHCAMGEPGTFHDLGTPLTIPKRFRFSNILPVG